MIPETAFESSYLRFHPEMEESYRFIRASAVPRHEGAAGAPRRSGASKPVQYSSYASVMMYWENWSLLVLISSSPMNGLSMSPAISREKSRSRGS